MNPAIRGPSTGPRKGAVRSQLLLCSKARKNDIPAEKIIIGLRISKFTLLTKEIHIRSNILILEDIRDGSS